MSNPFGEIEVDGGFAKFLARRDAALPVAPSAVGRGVALMGKAFRRKQYERLESIFSPGAVVQLSSKDEVLMTSGSGPMTWAPASNTQEVKITLNDPAAAPLESAIAWLDRRVEEVCEVWRQCAHLRWEVYRDRRGKKCLDCGDFISDREQRPQREWGDPLISSGFTIKELMGTAMKQQFELQRPNHGN